MIVKSNNVQANDNGDKIYGLHFDVTKNLNPILFSLTTDGVLDSSFDLQGFVVRGVLSNAPVGGTPYDLSQYRQTVASYLPAILNGITTADPVNKIIYCTYYCFS